MSLIARETELDAVVARLRDHRLVTIVGPGGVGKTTLARAAADTAEPEFALGVRTVDLTRIDDPDGVRELIAGQLGFADFDSLLNSPGDQAALVVMDNCEHVLDAAADAIDQILRACRSPTVIATSRSPLDIGDEVIVPLAPLPVPPRGSLDNSNAAVQMFTQRVREFGGRIDNADDDVVGEICRRLDGMPLALELAAARARTRTIDEILAEIDERPVDLARPRFRGRSAHRSVADMVEGSLTLLSEPTCAAFETLGAIAGPFTSGMAHAVMAVESPLSAQTLLDELIDASLVVADTSSTQTWYRLLHPIRAVAHQRLSDAGHLDGAVGRVVDYVLALSIEFGVGSSFRWGEQLWGEQLSTLLGMYDNLIASLRWANEHDEHSDRPLTLLAVLWGVVHQSHTAEVGALGDTVLATWPDRDAPFWADAAATVATCRNLLGDPVGAIDLATTALDHVGASMFAPASLRRVIALAERARGNADISRTWFEDAADAAVHHQVHGFAMELRVEQALLTAELDDHDGALELVDAVAAEAERREAPINRAWARAGRGTILLEAGDDRALTELEDALEFARSIRYPAGVSLTLRMIAGAHLGRGDIAHAATALLELLDVLLERGGLNDLRLVLDHAAEVLDAVDDPSWLDVAATAQVLPVTTVGAPVRSEVFDRAAGRGDVLAVPDVYRLCRERLLPVSTGKPPMDPLGSAQPDVSPQSIVHEGDTWRWMYRDSAIVVKDSKGMRDLVRLLAEPGREISALDLMGSTKMSDDVADTFDTHARKQVENRIRELQADIEEAETNNDLVRAERASAEMDRLIDELTAAVGLGGRTRRTGTDPERARSAVTQRIRSTIKRIDRLHAHLGSHLATTIDTGTFCVYRPTEPLRWHIDR